METKNEINWNVRAERDTYGPKETVRILGSFQSLIDESRDWRVHTLIEKVDDDTIPLGIIPYSFTLEPKTDDELVIREFVVSDDYPPGEYSIKVGLEISRGETDFKDVRFRIEGTPIPFKLSVIISQDYDLKIQKRIFTSQHKEAFISIESEIDGFALTGICISPSGRESTIEFTERVASILIPDVGIYKLEILAEKSGYKSISKKTSFSVIEQHPSFKGIEFLRKK